MTLIVGTAPFGSAAAGRSDVDPHAPEHVLHVEPSPRRVRVLLGGETVVESTRAQLLRPPGQTAMSLFPREDVRTDLLEASGRTAAVEDLLCLSTERLELTVDPPVRG